MSYPIENEELVTNTKGTYRKDFRHIVRAERVSRIASQGDNVCGARVDGHQREESG